MFKSIQGILNDQELKKKGRNFVSTNTNRLYNYVFLNQSEFAPALVFGIDRDLSVAITMQKYVSIGKCKVYLIDSYQETTEIQQEKRIIQLELQQNGFSVKPFSNTEIGITGILFEKTAPYTETDKVLSEVFPRHMNA